MVKVAILGHSPEHLDLSIVSVAIDNALNILKYQYKTDLGFNITEDPGIAHLSAIKLKELQLPYEIWLSNDVDSVAQVYFTKEQFEQLNSILSNASKINIFTSVVLFDTYESRIKYHRFENIKKMINNSQWVLAFWNGKKQGLTYKAVEYAFNCNKVVLNGLNNLQIISSLK